MMAFFRALVKSWVAKILLGLLVISFAIWGVHDVFHAKISDAVIQAGSRQVTSPDYKRIFDQQLKEAQQQVGHSVTTQEAVDQGFDRQILEGMADNESLAEVVHRDDVRPSDKLVVAELRKSQGFFNPVTGAFDQQTYEQLLAQNNLTPAQFEKGLRDDIAQSHFSIGMVAGLRAPRAYSALIAAFNLESRGAVFTTVTPQSVGMPPKPTDAELMAFMQENSSRLKRPELRQISMVRISAAALAPTLPADPAEVQKRFDFEKARLSQPEKRSFVQIPIKTAQQAAAIVARLNQGSDPAAVAQAIGVKPIVYADTAKAAVADPKVADAAFAMSEGQTSGPVQGEFGLAVVKVSKITAAHPASLEEARPQIETQVKAEAAQEKVFDQVQKYSDAHDAGASMAAAAKTAGVQVFVLGPMTADGHTITGQPIVGLNQQMLAQAFSLAQGQETDMADLGKGEYYSLHVDRVAPSALPPLEEVRGPLTQYFMAQALTKRMQAKADELAARVRKGETIQAVAASQHLGMQQADAISRQTAQEKAKTLGGDFLNKLFAAKKGEVFTAAANGAPGVVVGQVVSVTPAPLDQVARATEAQRPQLTMQMVQSEFSEMLRTAARNKIKPKVDLALARKAISANPPSDEAAPKSGAKAASKKAQ